MADIVDEVKQLRQLYNTRQYDAMRQHINQLTMKYLQDTGYWNITHPDMPYTDQQRFINAEAFLKAKGFSVLAKYGIRV